MPCPSARSQQQDDESEGDTDKGGKPASCQFGWPEGGEVEHGHEEHEPAEQGGGEKILAQRMDEEEQAKSEHAVIGGKSAWRGPGDEFVAVAKGDDREMDPGDGPGQEAEIREDQQHECGKHALGDEIGVAVEVRAKGLYRRVAMRTCLGEAAVELIDQDGEKGKGQSWAETSLGGEPCGAQAREQAREGDQIWKVGHEAGKALGWGFTRRRSGQVGLLRGMGAGGGVGF